MTGHFTAEIWKGVTSVGYGYAVAPTKIGSSKGYAIYVVANFYPVPNVWGQYVANVPKLLSKWWKTNRFNSKFVIEYSSEKSLFSYNAIFKIFKF